MKVLFDGYWWSKGPAANRSVQRDLILAWAREFPHDDIAIALRRTDAAPDLDAGFERVSTQLWPHGASNVLELGRLARSINADVIVSHNYAPLTGRSAVFIHDAMFDDHAEWFSSKERVYFSGMLPSSRRANFVTTSTRTEAARIERLAPGLAPVTAIGLAVPSALADAVPARPSSVTDGLRFSLTVGRLNVRKNLQAVLQAARLSSSVTPEQPLLVVGSSEYSGVDAELPEEHAELVREGSVRFLSRVSDEELAWLYGNASLAISLSLDEGFGLTPVEACWFGTPLLVSDIAVHRETVGDIAHFVDPNAEPQAIADTLDHAWGTTPDSEARSALKARFTWEGSAHRLRAAIVGKHD